MKLNKQAMTLNRCHKLQHILCLCIYFQHYQNINLPWYKTWPAY